MRNRLCRFSTWGLQATIVQILTIGLYAADPQYPGYPQTPYRTPTPPSRSASSQARGTAPAGAYGQPGGAATTGRSGYAATPGRTPAAGLQPRPAGAATPSNRVPATTIRERAPSVSERSETEAKGSVRSAEQSAPTPEQALRLSPLQSDVDISRPAPEDVAKCKVTAQRINGHIGWIVEDPSGLILRKFVDTNGDNKVDLWCYYKDGLEVYRDIDSDFNGKADQYRWFTTAGSRWGIDKDESGAIDAWQAISPEETTAEIVAALARQDSARFARVALTPDEAKSLGLGPTKTQELLDKLNGISTKFKDLAAQRNTLNEKTAWVHFSGSQPGVVPIGTDGSTREMQVYENVVAIVQTKGQHSQVQIGTLVKVGEVWKAIDAPQILADGQAEQASSGFFFRVPTPARPQAPANMPSEKSQEVLVQLERLQAAATKAGSVEEQARLNAQQASLLEKMLDEATKPEDRTLWARQMADTIGAAVQSGGYPDGGKRLEVLFEKVARNSQDKGLAAHVRFVQLTAQYAIGVREAKGGDFAKIQTEWLKRLEEYVREYSKSPEAAEAMLQLAIAQEFAGQEDEARKWYAQIANDFPDSATGQKAQGAKVRLDSVGKVLRFQGKGPGGEVVDIAKHRGQVLVIQYWATWCEPCKADMATLKELLRKHGKNLAVVGVNLDNTDKTMAAFLEENRLPWPQIYEPGGLDSRPAVELGVLTLPTMILVDQEGRVVNRNINGTDLDNEVKKLLK